MDNVISQTSETFFQLWIKLQYDHKSDIIYPASLNSQSLYVLQHEILHSAKTH